MQSELEYLGYRANALKILPSTRHIEAMQNYPMPINHKQLKKCLGLFPFFRKLLTLFSKTSQPLNQRIQK